MGGRATAGGNEESRALTQDHHPLEHGWMQEAASASLAFPKREAKALPNVLGLEGAVPCQQEEEPQDPSRKWQVLPRGITDSNIWPTNCNRSMGTKAQAFLFLPHTLGPPTHPKSPHKAVEDSCGLWGCLTCALRGIGSQTSSLACGWAGAVAVARRRAAAAAAPAAREGPGQPHGQPLARPGPAVAAVAGPGRGAQGTPAWRAALMA